MRCTLPLYGTLALSPPVVLEHPLGWLKTRQKHQYGGFNKRTHPTKTIHFSCTSCILWFKKAPKGWAENPPKYQNGGFNERSTKNLLAFRPFHLFMSRPPRGA